MPPISHQTIKLSRGRHSSPEHGACVMELASMLAGESFSDHPRSVSRPIASFLRGYNDLVDDRRRADLYRYAAEAVAPVAGPGATAFAKAAAKLQTVLGEHQDSVTAQAWLRDAKVTGRRAFVAGELIALERLAANAARAKWRKAWDSLDRKRLREWML